MAGFAAAQFANIFAHPLMSYVWPDGPQMNLMLRERILAHQKATPGLKRTNVGGWHSENGRLEFLGATGEQLVRHMIEMGDEATRLSLNVTDLAQVGGPFTWALDAWVNINDEGDFNRVHTHPGSTWSGTYYVDAGDPPKEAPQGTPIHLYDPCQGRANQFLPPLAPTSYLIAPEPGLMILFPSYVPHMVFAHRGSRPRISIAFNLRREPFP